MNNARPRIPRIALLSPHEDERPATLALFQRHEFSLRTVSDLAAIEDLVAEEEAPFDCVVIPPKTQTNQNAVGLLLQLKTHEKLKDVPTLALCHAKDKSTLHTLYGAGLDVALLEPFDPDHLYQQILSLCRQRQNYVELIRTHYEDTGMRQSLINAFNAIREGVIILDADQELMFINSTGATLLGIKPSHTLEQVQTLITQFKALVVKHENSVQAQQRNKSSATEVSQFSNLIQRLDGRSFKAEVRVTLLYGDQNQVIGSSIALSDLSGILQLSQLLIQAQRTRTLALLTGAGCLQLLGNNSTLNPLQMLEEQLEKSQAAASVGDTMSYLLELLDVVILPGVEVKIKARGDWMVAVRPADLFQLLGNITLLAVENAILGGEIVLDVEDSEPRVLKIIVLSRAESRIRFLQDDLVSQIIDGSLSHVRGEQQQKVSQTFTTAQRIASRYRGTVLVERASELELKVSVDLPLLGL
jgi:DNA-binding response OmpR family regulator